MIITSEEDQLEFEQKICKGFSKHTAGMDDVRTKLFESLSDAEREEVARSIQMEEGERLLLVCVRSQASWAVMSNKRLIWQTDGEPIKALGWGEIISIEQGTGLQREKLRSLDGDERTIEQAQWEDIEVSDHAGTLHTIRLEKGKALDSVHWCLIAQHGSYWRQREARNDMEAYVAHRFSSWHREQILESEQCGCFYCLEIFRPDEIDDWVDRDEKGVGQTAMCPRCGIDSVIGSKAGYPISEEFLKRMNVFWFGVAT